MTQGDDPHHHDEILLVGNAVVTLAYPDWLPCENPETPESSSAAEAEMALATAVKHVAL